MAFKRDDDELAFAVLFLCDALDDGATNAETRIDAITKARKCAHRVLDRGGKNQDKQPETPAERTETSGHA
jgi:hypothetical protein